LPEKRPLIQVTQHLVTAISHEPEIWVLTEVSKMADNPREEMICGVQYG
jgi:hypothetical protein